MFRTEGPQRSVASECFKRFNRATVNVRFNLIRGRFREGNFNVFQNQVFLFLTLMVKGSSTR